MYFTQLPSAYIASHFNLIYNLRYSMTIWNFEISNKLVSNFSRNLWRQIFRNHAMSYGHLAVIPYWWILPIKPEQIRLCDPHLKTIIKEEPGFCHSSRTSCVFCTFPNIFHDRSPEVALTSCLVTYILYQIIGRHLHELLKCAKIKTSSQNNFQFPIFSRNLSNFSFASG